MLSDSEESSLRSLLSETRLQGGEVLRVRELLADSRQVGSPSLLRRLFRLVYDATITIATGGPHATGPIEAQEDRQHAFYVLSALRLDTNTEEVIYGGTVAVFPSNSVTVAIARRYNSGPPTKVETYLETYNTKGTSVAVQVKVYRLAGLI